MNIAVIGAGYVGGTLGKKWSIAGHNVFFGVRDPRQSKYQTLLKECSESATMQTVEAAIDSARLVVVALPWNSVEAVIKNINLKDKVIIDCTNPIAQGFKLLFPNTTSGAEQIASWAPGSCVFKAFNTTGWENMENPDFNGTAATMFYCGDTSNHKNDVQKLIEDIGFEPWYVGDLAMARYLEPLAMLWISEAIVRGKGRNIAFKMMRR